MQNLPTYDDCVIFSYTTQDLRKIESDKIIVSGEDWHFYFTLPPDEDIHTICSQFAGPDSTLVNYLVLTKKGNVYFSCNKYYPSFLNAVNREMNLIHYHCPITAIVKVNDVENHSMAHILLTSDKQLLGLVDRSLVHLPIPYLPFSLHEGSRSPVIIDMTGKSRLLHTDLISTPSEPVIAFNYSLDYEVFLTSQGIVEMYYVPGRGRGRGIIIPPDNSVITQMAVLSSPDDCKLYLLTSTGKVYILIRHLILKDEWEELTFSNPITGLSSSHNYVYLHFENGEFERRS